MKFLGTLLIVIAFFGSFLLGFGVQAKANNLKLYNIGDVNSLPVISSDVSKPDFSAEGVIAVDSSSNTTLFEKNADQELLPASTTKIITALVSLDYYKESDVLTVLDPYVEGQKMGLVRGEKMTFENLLNGLLIYSANDAAVALADNYPGGRAAFVSLMNSKALSLHLDHTHFANPIGLDDTAQFTTPRDMVRVSEVAMQNPIFANIVGTKEKVITDITGKFSYDLNNVNALLGSVPGVVGVKTGYTEGARENLITNVTRNGHSVYIALLGSDDRFGETKKLIDWIYGNYTWRPVSFLQKAVSWVYSE